MELKSSYICLLCNRVATSGRLSKPSVCGVSSTCPSQTLPTSLLRLCITALSYSKTAWMKSNFLSPKCTERHMELLGPKAICL